MFGLTTTKDRDYWKDSRNEAYKYWEAAEIKIIHLNAKISGYEKAHKPVYNNKAKRWQDGITGAFVRAPDPIVQEHKEACAAYGGLTRTGGSDNRYLCKQSGEA